MRSPAVALALVLALPGVALADRLVLGPDATEPVEVQLDGDAHLERLVPERVRDSVGFEQRRIVLEDDCGPEGAGRRIRLSSLHDRAVATLVEADREPRTEIEVHASSGASGRVGQVKVVRLGAPRPGAALRCEALHTLFSYFSTRPRYRPPRGWYVNGFGIRLAEYARRYRGKEIRLDESLGDRDDPGCCPSRRRISHFRLGRGDRYVRYRTRTIPLRRGR